MPDCGIKGVRETIEGHISGGRESGCVGQWNRLVVGRFIGMAGFTGSTVPYMSRADWSSRRKARWLKP
ncbi:hypothetical protein N7465_000377 [Penicillium sp. CMV-2018d]|nr:hypothetical protein N7465_000377 [Penicillium sp. CMV-2018d]